MRFGVSAAWKDDISLNLTYNEKIIESFHSTHIQALFAQFQSHLSYFKTRYRHCQLTVAVGASGLLNTAERHSMGLHSQTLPN